MGLQPAFDIRSSPDVTDAVAAFRGPSPVILYNEGFMEQVIGVPDPQWEAASILAHAMGHHMLGHELDIDGVRLEAELEADRYSGFVLQRMGATVDEAVAVATRLPTMSSSTHPDRRARAAAIAAGWEEARSLVSLQVSKAPPGGLPTPQAREPVLKANVAIGSKAAPANYATRVVFDGDPSQYLVRPDDRIIAIPPGGKAIWAGKKIPPRSSSFAWTFWSPYGSYNVLPDGTIVDRQQTRRGYVAAIRGRDVGGGGSPSKTFVSNRTEPFGAVGPSGRAVSAKSAGSPEVPSSYASLGVNSDTLEQADLEANGRFFDVWLYRGRAGEELNVSVTSEAFDSYVIVADAGIGTMDVLAEDDDGGQGVNSSLTVRLTQSEDYKITVTSFSPGELGSYDLTIHGPSSNGSALPLLSVGTTRAALVTTDPIRENGTHYRAWRFEGLAGQRLTVDMTSANFDTYLLFGRGRMGAGFERIAEDDDNGAGTNSQVSVTLPEDGSYTVVASSYGIEYGAFALIVERYAAPVREIPNATTEIGRGRAVRLELTRYCTFDGSPIEGNTIYAFASDQSAREALDDALRPTGVDPSTFEIFAADVGNAAALIERGTRLILYDPAWIAQLADWSSIAVLLHEVGHHLYGHTLDNVGSRPPRELEADEFAGFHLYNLGASLEQVVGVMSMVPEDDSPTHPGRGAREMASTNGWREAQREDDDSVDPPPVRYRLEFFGDPNIYFDTFDDTIVMVKPNGSVVPIGRVVPPAHPMFVRMLFIDGNNYGVDSAGTIVGRDNYGNLMSIGRVRPP